MAESASWVRELGQLFPNSAFKYQEPMAAHTTFRIGGPAECMAFPRSGEELAALLRFAAERELPCLLMGGGSNLLAPDEGLHGLVIQTRENLTAISRTGVGEITAACGVPLPRLAAFAAEQGLTGLEFAQGIPGTVGGGVYMNAGAYDGEMAFVVQSVLALDAQGADYTLTEEELHFGHRQSAFMECGGIVVSAVLRLREGDPTEIREKMQDFGARRREKQPLELPSAGSAFKRPQGGYAAALIDRAGLKGLQVGGAAVSEKHAGFIVNLGGATAQDVRRLIEQIRERVLAESGILLEPEIRIL